MQSKNLEKEIVNYIVKNQNNYYRLAYSYVKNSEDALDIVQESIYKALSTMHSLRNPEGIKTWFYKIVVNTSIDYIRKHKKELLINNNLTLNESLDNPQNVEYIDLREHINTLPHNYRIIIILRFFEDLKLDEIAEILNENINTVKTRLYKALKTLNIQLNE